MEFNMTLRTLLEKENSFIVYLDRQFMTYSFKRRASSDLEHTINSKKDLEKVESKYKLNDSRKMRQEVLNSLS